MTADNQEEYFRCLFTNVLSVGTSITDNFYPGRFVKAAL